MANVNSLTIGNTSLPVANSLASLSDVSTANTAEGNILTFDGTAWTNGTLTGNSGISVSRTGANYVLKGSTSWAQTQAIGAPLTGLDHALYGAVTESDTVLSAIGKLSGLHSASIAPGVTVSRSGRICQLNIGLATDAELTGIFTFATIQEAWALPKYRRFFIGQLGGDPLNDGFLGVFVVELDGRINAGTVGGVPLPAGVPVRAATMYIAAN